ncbi:NAD-dependent epimerase/dehydratase family protein [Devosia riboflavina]
MHESRLTRGDLDDMLRHAEIDLRALAGARLLLTGGTGYIGRWLLEGLLHANRELRLGMKIGVLSRRPEHFLETHPHLGGDTAVSFLTGDIRDFAVPEGAYSHAIHAATDVIADNAPLETFDVTVQGTRRLLDVCRERGVERVLLLSSGAVYGRIPPALHHVPEQHRGAPRTDTLSAAYGLGKMATEWLGTAYAADSRLQCSSARVFAQIGPYLALDRQFAAGNFIDNALRRAPFVIKGDGTPRRSYMYGTDLFVWLLAILVRGAANRAYNVGSDQAVSIVELAAAIAEAAGIVQPDIRVLGVAEPAAQPEYYVPDISRARHELDLVIRVPFMDALQRTLAWYKPLLTGSHS